jgi:hypothetical protein
MGRILEAFRAVIGGTKPLEVDASLMDMIPNPVFREWRYRTRKQLSDIYIRRNMLSTTYQ